jgi:hypothetical protein
MAIAAVEWYMLARAEGGKGREEKQSTYNMNTSTEGLWWEVYSEF